MKAIKTWSLATVLAMLGLAACSSDAESSDPGTSTTALTTSTAGPTTVTPTETTGPLDTTEESLVYVVMGNSLLFSTPAVMYAYRDVMQEDLAVEIDMRDHTVGGQATADFLAQLRTNERLRADMREADVVLFVIPNDEWKEPASTIAGHQGRDPADCGGDDGRECLREAIAEYKTLTDEILGEVTALADPSEVVIRVADFHLFSPGDNDEADREKLLPLWQEAQDYVEEAAAAHGIPVAQVFEEFMSPDGKGLPEEKGLVSADGVHFTSEGTAMVVRLLRELGYEPAA